jgi:hypothetical protein
VLSVIEKVALTALILGVPLEDVELRVINLLWSLNRPVKSTEGGCVISPLHISVVHGAVQSTHRERDLGAESEASDKCSTSERVQAGNWVMMLQQEQ